MTNRRVLLLGSLMLLLSACLHPQPRGVGEEFSALREDMEAVKKTQREILEGLQEIKKLVQSKRSRGFEPTDVTVEGSPFLGDKSAKVTVIEFTDYECAFCAKYFQRVFPRIIEDYVETGKVRYVVRQFPLVTMHKAASKASEVSLCAKDQGKHWEMHDQMFKNQKALGSQALKTLVEAVGLDSKKIQDCLDTGKYTEKVQADIAEGRELGVKGTPAFVFGLTKRNDSKIKATKLLKGYVPYAQMVAVIDVLLSADSTDGM